MSAPRPRPPRAEGRLPLWLGVAAALHVVGLAGAGKLRREHAGLAAEPGGGPIVPIDVAAEPTAAVAKPPEPASPPRLAPAADNALATRGAVAPPVHKAPSPRPSPKAPGSAENLTERLGKVVSSLAAEASRLLTSPDGHGPPMATGNAEAAYGMVAGDGQGTSPTFDPRAGLRGGRGGSGRGGGTEPGVDRSRGPTVSMGLNDDCDFPPEADDAHVDHGWARLSLTIGPDGRATRVELLGDSGHGFGRVAVECAREAVYGPALDRDGKPIAQDYPPFTYRFTR